MTQSEDRKKRPSPPAQTYWRRNVFGKGITLPEQQVTACHRGHRRHDGIKYNKERIFPNLIVHD